MLRVIETRPGLELDDAPVLVVREDASEPTMARIVPESAVTHEAAEACGLRRELLSVLRPQDSFLANS